MPCKCSFLFIERSRSPLLLLFSCFSRNSLFWCGRWTGFHGLVSQEKIITILVYTSLHHSVLPLVAIGWCKGRPFHSLVGLLLFTTSERERGGWVTGWKIRPLNPQNVILVWSDHTARSNWFLGTDDFAQKWPGYSDEPVNATSNRYFGTQATFLLPKRCPCNSSISRLNLHRAHFAFFYKKVRFRMETLHLSPLIDTQSRLSGEIKLQLRSLLAWLVALSNLTAMVQQTHGCQHL